MEILSRGSSFYVENLKGKLKGKDLFTGIVRKKLYYEK